MEIFTPYSKVQVNEMNIGMAVHRLLEIFLSSKRIQEAKDQKKIKYSYNPEIALDQIKHLSIEIAILYRIEDTGCSEHEFEQAKKNRIVGDLYEPIESEKQALAMRVACNKIIHAETINFDYSQMPKTNSCYLNPILYIWSKKK